MLLTGYLLSVKTIPLQWKALKAFYAGLFKVIATYLLCCVIIFLFRVFWLKEDLMFRDILLFGLGYGGYSWYVNMYIGLYLMIPLLNHIWHSAETKESQIIIVVIFLVLTVVPTVFNIWNWHVDGAILHPWVTDTFDGLVPDWWTDLHPITYFRKAFPSYDSFSSARRYVQLLAQLQRLFCLGQLVCTMGISERRKRHAHLSFHQFHPL